MTTVLLCGGENGGQMRQALVRALNQYGGVQRFAKEQLEGNHEPRFCLYECTKIPAVSHTAGVLILKNSYEEQEGPLQLSGLVPVLEQHNSRALHSLQGQNCNVISCGMSAKDTLSIASLDYNRAVVSLQRNLVQLSGSVIEPHDFTVQLSEETGVYPLLACCAVLLLAGVPSSQGYAF